MTGLRICTLLAVTSCVAGAMLALGPGNAHGAECKRKTAGFYLEDTNANGVRRLSASLQSLPGTLTGTAGNAERGREVLVSRQRGDCLSCHQVTSLSSIAGQGGIGPALDGVGAKFSDPQLRKILLEPKDLFPDTIMPSFIGGRPPGPRY